MASSGVGVLVGLLYKEKKETKADLKPEESMRISACCAVIGRNGLVREKKNDLLVINSALVEKENESYIPGTHNENLVIDGLGKIQFQKGDRLKICQDFSPEWSEKYPSECMQLRKALGKALGEQRECTILEYKDGRSCGCDSTGSFFDVVSPKRLDDSTVICRGDKIVLEKGNIKKD